MSETPPEQRFLSAHRFRAAAEDSDRFAADVIAACETMTPVEGVSRVIVLRDEGSSELALIAEWTSGAEARRSWHAFYQSEQLRPILQRAMASDSALYSVVAEWEVPSST